MILQRATISRIFCQLVFVTIRLRSGLGDDGRLWWPSNSQSAAAGFLKLLRTVLDEGRLLCFQQLGYGELERELAAITV